MGKRITITALKMLIVAAFIGLPFVFVVSVAASTSQPDSPPNITSIWVNRNLYQDGDELIYGLYDIPYASLPSTSASTNFTFYLLSADGDTQLGYTVPYVTTIGGYTTGYNKGLISFYFASGLTWEAAYIIQIAENPTQFDSLVNYTFTLTASNYTTLTTQADNQTELTSNLLNIGTTLKTAYGVTLFQTANNIEVLTAEGETYFRGAIPNVQYLAPSLFLLQQSQLDVTPIAWTTSQFDSYMGRFNGTWVGTSQSLIASQMGMTDVNLAMMLVATVPMCIGVIVFSAKKFRRAEPGFVGACTILMMAALMGWIPTAIFASIFQGLGVYSAFLIFYSRG